MGARLASVVQANMLREGLFKHILRHKKPLRICGWVGQQDLHYFIARILRFGTAVAMLVSCQATGQQLPRFGNAPLEISDTQVRYTRAPDDKTASIIFDTFSIALHAGGPRFASRSLGFVLPVTGVATPVPVMVIVCGLATLQPDTRATVVAKVAGQTRTLDFAGPSPDELRGYQALFHLPAVDDAGIPIVLLIAIERTPRGKDASAILSIDNIEAHFESEGGQGRNQALDTRCLGKQ